MGAIHMPAPAPVEVRTSTVGTTPVVKLTKVISADSADVYVKSKAFDPTGSCKDRMALARIKEAERHGDS
jgi:cysteine synthase A